MALEYRISLRNIIGRQFIGTRQQPTKVFFNETVDNACHATLKINEWQQLSVSSGAFINETLHIRRARANTEMGNLSHSHILGQSGNFDQKNTPIFNYATITYGLENRRLPYHHYLRGENNG